MRGCIAEAEKRVHEQIGAETLVQKIMGYFGDLKRLWHDGLTVEERKDLL